MAEFESARRLESLSERFRREQAAVANRPSSAGAAVPEDDLHIVSIDHGSFEESAMSVARPYVDGALLLIVVGALLTAAYLLLTRYRRDSVVLKREQPPIERRSLRRAAAKQ